MDVDDVGNMVYLELPPTLVTTPKDINQGTGLKVYTKSLIRKKKATVIGHQVLDAEEELSHNKESYTLHANAHDMRREFYYSRSNCNRKRRLELTKRRYRDKTAAIERKFSGTKKPIMFIGGRGHGIGSSIKEHQRFGGFKKQNKHSQNTPTLITNEYNSSQTCLFCFNKLSHPVSAADDKISISKRAFIYLNSNYPMAFKPMCRDKIFAL
ncbi:hypothetical protein BDF21DRAFT_451115 [Thamnidium elegans]|nr:hypothetical protein BDF21DRAFT_451115 [Thamnidium elegans]